MDQNTTTLITATYNHLTHGTPVDDTTVRALAALIDDDIAARDALIICALAPTMTLTDTLDVAQHPHTPGNKQQVKETLNAICDGLTPIDATGYRRLMALAERMRGVCAEHANMATALAMWLAWLTDDMDALHEQSTHLDPGQLVPSLAAIAAVGASAGVRSHAVMA
ncbi:hypothetical protein PG2049B_1117 [Bifidobacterium pseudolongum subsp. globosum]|uniref:Uncharacterized protein n=1 Tax=Bifidobacterium pseudolongum subsp. globosum TaxID=1690 RepID=A0A4Q5AJR4_9BIFI|nr:hypothetical protein [Bifidobacterium pseudolongum]RYQ21235.1 hypothetical protein PG2049B_1117 [Bifidobacterium pseudolongum subsp. globosum]RYQ29802.1 hypothetical protein PG2017B_1083 [Bifidobacterium pseudolongum subsp. globosum]